MRVNKAGTRLRIERFRGVMFIEVVFRVPDRLFLLVLVSGEKKMISLGVVLNS